LTKNILITLGPSSMNEKTVKTCAEIGVYLFRINLSHTPIDQVEENIQRIQSWTDVPICLDSEGAQLRNGPMVSENVEFRKGDEVSIQMRPIIGDHENLSFNPAQISKQFKSGDIIKVDFNNASFEIVDQNSEYFTAIVASSGFIGSNKAADVNRELQFDPLTEKDRQAIKIGVKNGIKNFAMSFTNQPEDVDLIRELCSSDANIICKIESPSALINLEKIIERADEILIDRGDLSRKIQIQRIAFLQRRIISAARSMGTPVYVATNLLESMVTTDTPNRAEVNDVVSTLEMGANGLVLAAETAIGKFPIHAVKMIRSLINEYECWTPDTTIIDLLKE